MLGTTHSGMNLSAREPPRGHPTVMRGAGRLTLNYDALQRSTTREPKSWGCGNAAVRCVPARKRSVAAKRRPPRGLSVLLFEHVPLRVRPRVISHAGSVQAPLATLTCPFALSRFRVTARSTRLAANGFARPTVRPVARSADPAVASGSWQGHGSFVAGLRHSRSSSGTEHALGMAHAMRAVTVRPPHAPDAPLTWRGRVRRANLFLKRVVCREGWQCGRCREKER